ncbi:Holliday junction resolvase RuvX [Megasphaera hutchinsoni]|uniref:Putative pre-16S rRNA nuclease n=1 Tax=Megasphaera hutchinsoni TaxID=1588748 RepID=A0A134CF15_9FIRM|nr:Holliday junction resolvase RuvX [Megasphaera hutchinsoni]KXB90828.1 RNAse H domain protein, YqgF family [Megasphaera hutchinsoni]
MRIIGLDIGSKTIGVACSDALQITAQGVYTIKRKNEKEDWLALQAVATERQVTRIVVGRPRHMNGTDGDNVKAIEVFVRYLQKKMPQMEFVYWDERLTTIMAEQVLMEGGVRREKRKQFLDTMAAVLILQNYLDAQK